MCVQIEIEASDQGVPPQSSNVTVYVTVSRNESIPRFEEKEYEVEVEQSVETGHLLLTVTAAYDTPTDTQVCVCSPSLSFNEPCVVVAGISSAVCGGR